MPKPLRLTLALLSLGLSLALLAWSLLPGPRNVRRQPIEPTQMQLPTPEASLPGKRQLAHIPNPAACVLHDTGFVVLTL